MEQAPDLNNLERNPDIKAIKLTRAAQAAYEREHPSTPGQVAAASSEGTPDLTAIRQHFADSQAIESEQSESKE